MGRAGAGESLGYTWRRLRMIIADFTDVMMLRPARNMRRMWMKFSSARGATVARSRRSLRRRCRASLGRLSFRRIIWRKRIGGVRGRGGASPLGEGEREFAG